MARDQIYQKPLSDERGHGGDPNPGAASSREPEFVFDERVAAVFDDMIERSVPTYAGSLEFISKVWKHWQRPGATLLDLGCSTGSALRRIIELTQVPNVCLVGVDNSLPMLQLARKNLEALAAERNIELTFSQGKLEELELPAANGALLNFTLQFVAPEDRLSVLKKVRSSLATDGFLILSEKIRHDDTRTGELLNEIHLDFKRSQGYSELEISRKRAALENVLIPWTLEENLATVRAAGFSSAHVALLWCNFVTILARG